jgi:polyisoprenoid-binding protein YceI
MEIAAGTYTFGPENGAMWVKTERGGAAAVAGHDLVIEVTDWYVVLEVRSDSASSSLTAGVDSTSLRVREGYGGMQPLDDADRASIDQTINDEVLEGTEIAFRSTSVQTSEVGFTVEGELVLAGIVHPLAFDIAVDGNGRLSTTVVLKHGREFEVLATNELDETVDASPAIVGNEIFIRGSKHLYCIAEE